MFLFIGEPLPLNEYVHQLEGSPAIPDADLLGEGFPTIKCESGAVHIHLPSMLLALLTNRFLVPLLACLLAYLNLPREHVSLLLFCLPAPNGYLANPDQAHPNQTIDLRSEWRQS